LKLNGTHQLLVYADDVNVLGGSTHAIKKNTEALVVANKKIGLEVNAEKTKYMVISRDQNSGQNHNIKIDNKSFERVEQFKYLGTTLMNQNPIQEELKSRLKSGNACYFKWGLCQNKTVYFHCRYKKITSFFFSGVTAQLQPRPPHCWGF
jgi:hypothetical protein